MKVLAKYTEFISDNHQGGSGSSHERTTLVDIAGFEETSIIFNVVEKTLKEKYRPLCYHGDSGLLRLNSIEIFS